MVFDVEVTNPYALPLPITALDYSLASGESTFLTGQKTSAELIPANGKATVELPAEVVYADLLRSVQGVNLGAVVPYTAKVNIKADAPGIGPIELPVSHSGQVPVPAPPEVSLEGVEWTKIGLDEAQATARLKVRNTNSFPVDLEKLDYKLSLAQKPVADGAVSEALHFEPDAIQTVTIPLKVSAAKLGFGIISLARGKSSDYQIDGTIKLGSSFGPIGTTYSKQGKVGFGK